MAQPNRGAALAGLNGASPRPAGAAPVVNAIVIPQLVGVPVGGAGQDAAPMAGPPVAPVAVAVALLFPAYAPARFDVDAALRGPLPTKSNVSFKLHPKIVGKPTGP